MAPNNNRLKQIVFTIDETNNFQCQLNNWEMQNNTEDGEKGFTYCPDGEYREETDDDYALSLTFLSDWKLNGISDYLQLHDKEIVTFVLDHHPDKPLQHVRWEGELRIKAPNVGGDVRTTETQSIVLPCIGKPVYSRPGGSS